MMGSGPQLTEGKSIRSAYSRGLASCKALNDIGDRVSPAED